MEAGKKLREKISRASQSAWKPAPHRADPIEILKAGDAQRLPELVPIRYGRMLKSPFAFYRGSAAIMAADLATTPTTNIRVQACGDCHLVNFGGFATPERRLIFDINDMDETLPAPWEWDLKRLVASFVLAARTNNLSDRAARASAVAAAESYRQHMRELADMDVLEIWYSSITEDDFVAELPANRRIDERRRDDKAMKASSHNVLFSKLIEKNGKELSIRDQPPLVYHAQAASKAHYKQVLEETFDRYRQSLQEDRRTLLERYRLVDAAVKVVGVGSVGTLCMVLLLMSVSDRPLLLQLKQANRSVLEPFAGDSAFPHHGQRVVNGQRLIQPASDLFLGWATGPQGKHFYIRQLRDVKIPPLVETYDTRMLGAYARICGRVLARAHARSTEPWTIAGYLGRKDTFDEAMGDFAVAYADQAERDHARLKSAVRAGEIEVRLEE
jgi:uncharacterized protein (DUF2252 family)